MIDIKPKEEYRENLVFVIFNKHKNLLNALINNPNPNYKTLKERTKYSGGSLYNTIKDAKIMGLVKNGYGLSITPLGISWLNSCGDGNYPNKEILKQACNEVPLFKKIFNENPELISTKKLIEEFLQFTPENVDQRMIASSVKRYLEGIHNIKVKSISRYIQDKYKNTNTKLIQENFVKYSEGILILKNFKRFYSLENKDIKDMIKSLPENKRRLIEEAIFNEALN